VPLPPESSPAITVIANTAGHMRAECSASSNIPSARRLLRNRVAASRQAAPVARRQRLIGSNLAASARDGRDNPSHWISTGYDRRDSTTSRSKRRFSWTNWQAPFPE
jgi:hypothetical protein